MPMGKWYYLFVGQVVFSLAFYVLDFRESPENREFAAAEILMRRQRAWFDGFVLDDLIVGYEKHRSQKSWLPR